MQAKTKKRKGERRKDALLDTALELLLEKGFDGTTLRELAARAGCSLGLTYRYFRSKDEIVLHFYARMAEDFRGEMAKQPETSLAPAFTQAMKAKLASLERYRDLFGALLPKMARPDSPLSLFGPQAKGVRETTLGAFEDLVARTTSLSARPAHDLAIVLFIAHLGIQFLWLHDRKGDLTPKALALFEQSVGWMVPAVRLGVGRSVLRVWAEIFEGLIQSEEK